MLAVMGLAGCNGAEQVEQPDALPAAASSTISFTDVTDEAGLSGFRHENGAYGKRWFPEAMGSGGGFIDYDKDGWLDVVLAGGGTWPDSGEEPVQAIRLYRNLGDGSFREVTAEVGLGDVYAYSYGPLAADYDNDGDEDIFLTVLGKNLLFRNDGGRFIEVGEQAGVAGDEIWSTSAIFFDADKDGSLDLYVGSYVDWSIENDLVCTVDGKLRSYCTPELYSGIPSRFYHNNGDGTFSDWTERAGFLPAPGKTLGVTETDFNRDGWSDLIVANDTQPNLLYVNNGDGTFTERGALSGMAYDENGIARAGMGIDAGVVDTTGQVSMFVGNFSKEMIGVYRYMGDGLFIDRAAVSKIGRPSLLTLTFGLFLFDVDLDGDLDLFTANGHVQPEIEQTQEGIAYEEPPHLFINDGYGMFEDVAPRMGAPLTNPLVARGAAYGDYDRDGDLDVLLTENNGPAHLWRNDLIRSGAGAPSANYLRVSVEGKESNRDGLGTRVVATVNGRQIEHRIRTGSSFMSQMERSVTFGLGSADLVQSLVVEWPSGRKDQFTDVPANQEVLLVEGDGKLTPVPMSRQHVLASR